MFERLSAGELASARTMLLNRALKSDTVDLNGLRYIGDDTTVAALRAAQRLVSERPVDWDMARIDPAELSPLFAYLDGGAAEARERAAQLLARLSLPSTLARPLAERLCSIRYRAVALPLATAWLTTQGLRLHDTRAFQAHLPLIRSIVQAPPWQRAKLLARIASELQGDQWRR